MEQAKYNICQVLCTKPIDVKFEDWEFVEHRDVGQRLHVSVYRSVNKSHDDFASQLRSHEIMADYVDTILYDLSMPSPPKNADHKTGSINEMIKREAKASTKKRSRLRQVASDNLYIDGSAKALIYKELRQWSGTAKEFMEHIKKVLDEAGKKRNVKTLLNVVIRGAKKRANIIIDVDKTTGKYVITDKREEANENI